VVTYPPLTGISDHSGQISSTTGRSLGVSTFYDDLLVPRGSLHVRVCTGTACFAATGDRHVDDVQDALGLRLGERAGDRSSRWPRPSASATATPAPRSATGT